MMTYWNYGCGVPGIGLGILGLLLTVIFWVVVVYLIVLVLRKLFHGTHTRGRSVFERRSAALDLLEERYVKGEISREEYDQKKKDLMS